MSIRLHLNNRKDNQFSLFKGSIKLPPPPPLFLPSLNISGTTISVSNIKEELYWCSNLLLPCKQNDSQSNLFHYSLDKCQDPYAYDNCRDTGWANHHRKTVELCMLNILGTPEHQIKEDKGNKSDCWTNKNLKETDTGKVTLPHQIDWWNWKITLYKEQKMPKGLINIDGWMILMLTKQGLCHFFFFFIISKPNVRKVYVYPWYMSKCITRLEKELTNSSLSIFV